MRVKKNAFMDFFESMGRVYTGRQIAQAIFDVEKDININLGEKLVLALAKTGKLSALESASYDGRSKVSVEMCQVCSLAEANVVSGRTNQWMCEACFDQQEAIEGFEINSVQKAPPQGEDVV